MKIIRNCNVAVFALAATLLFAIPRSAAAQTGKGDDGQKIFEQNCVMCHGADGSGDTPVGKGVGAKDLRAPEAQKMTNAQISEQIEKGKGNMPPFGGTLNKAQIDSLIPYVRGLSKNQKSGKKSS